MNNDSKAVGESFNPDVPRAESVMKVCLLLSIALAVTLIVLAILSGKGALNTAVEVTTPVMLQAVFYLLARNKRTRAER